MLALKLEGPASNRLTEVDEEFGRCCVKWETFSNGGIDIMNNVVVSSCPLGSSHEDWLR